MPHTTRLQTHPKAFSGDPPSPRLRRERLRRFQQILTKRGFGPTKHTDYTKCGKTSFLPEHLSLSRRFVCLVGTSIAGRTAQLTRRAALRGITASICRPVPRYRCHLGVYYRACDGRCGGRVGRPWRLCSASDRALELSSSFFRSYYLSSVNVWVVSVAESFASTDHAKSIIIRCAREFGGKVLTREVGLRKDVSF